MSYNIKKIETGSYIEYYEYLKPIYCSTKKTVSKTDDITTDNKKSKTDEEKISERIRRMKLTRKQAKATLTRLIDTNFNNKTSFLTLTTKENIEDREQFLSMFKDFITRFNYQFFNTKKRVLKYIAVLEKQQRGAYHAHVVLFDVPYLDNKKLSIVWGHGFIKINKLEKLDDTANAGRYISKYFTKGIGEELLESLGKKSYLSSRNLRKPIVSKFYFDEDTLGVLKDEFEILYSSEYSSKIYSNGNYYEQVVKYRKVKKEGK